MKREVCVALTIISIVLLVSGVAFAALGALRLSEAEPPLPRDIPTSLPQDYVVQVAGNASATWAGGGSVTFQPPQLIGNGSLLVSQEPTFFIVPYGRATNLTVYFYDIGALQGRMEGSNATLAVVSPYTSVQPATTMGDHISFPYSIISANEKLVPTTPWIAVPLTLKEQQDHAWVIAKADVGVSYYTTVPAAPGKPFTLVPRESVQQLHRDLVFFVVSPEEYHTLEQHAQWASISFGFGLPKMDRSVIILAYSVCAFVGIVGGCLLLYYTRKRR